MDLIQTVTNAVVVGAVGVVLGLMVHGFRAEVKAEIGGVRTEFRADIAGLRAELKADIAELRTEVRADIAEVRREIADLRSDLTQVALAVGARSRSERRAT